MRPPHLSAGPHRNRAAGAQHRAHGWRPLPAARWCWALQGPAQLRSPLGHHEPASLLVGHRGSLYCSAETTCSCSLAHAPTSLLAGGRPALHLFLPRVVPCQGPPRANACSFQASEFARAKHAKNVKTPASAQTLAKPLRAVYSLVDKNKQTPGHHVARVCLRVLLTMCPASPQQRQRRDTPLAKLGICLVLAPNRQIGHQDTYLMHV